MIKQYLITLNIVIVSFYSTMSNAFPTNFKRLALFDTQGNLTKLVDLIGDIHAPSFDFAKKASKHRKKKYLKNQEKYLFTIAERTFLNTLREMAYGPKREAIILLWKMSHPRNKLTATITQTTQQAITDDYFKFNPFLKIEGHKLLHEFSTASNSNIHAFDTDILRISPISQMLNGLNNKYFMKYSVRSLIQPLYDLMNQKNLTFNKKLHAVKSISGDAVYKKIIAIWHAYLDSTLVPFLEKYIHPYLAKNTTISLGELADLLLQTQDPELEGDFGAFDLPIMDIETVTNIFVLPRQHFIVYAGSTHINNIQTLLVDHFDFTTLVDIGDNHDHAQEPFTIDPQLAPSAWKLLKLPLNTIMLSYKQQGPLIRYVNKDYWQDLITLLQQDPIDTIMLENWIKKGFKNHINSPNTRLHDKPLLIHAIERNDLHMAALLLKYGAIANPFLVDPITSEFISALEIAQPIGNNLMIDLLKQYKAQ